MSSENIENQSVVKELQVRLGDAIGLQVAASSETGTEGQVLSDASASASDTSVSDVSIDASIDASPSQEELDRERLARIIQGESGKRAYGTGRRKCSVARVWVSLEKGGFTINGKEVGEYFDLLKHRARAVYPFSMLGIEKGDYKVYATAKGGGMTGQADAVVMGIARALSEIDSDYFRPKMRAWGLLTRDARIVERKKPGLKKARRAPQFSKR